MEKLSTKKLKNKAKRKPRIVYPSFPLVNKLDFYIKKSGLKIYQLARQYGFERNALYAYRNGKRLPSLEQAFKLADALGVSVTDIWMKK